MFETGVKVIDLHPTFLEGRQDWIVRGVAGKTVVDHGADQQRCQESRRIFVFAGVGERTREGNDLWLEMTESAVIKPGKPAESKAALILSPDDGASRCTSPRGADRTYGRGIFPRRRGARYAPLHR